MIKRTLSIRLQEFVTTQRENIFHSRCEVKGKICCFIIDGGSCTNVVSQKMVEKLNLETKPHPHPYKLSWLSDEKDLIVKTQVDVELALERYKDTMTLDVVPMQATHLLLGRPWKYDKGTQHDGTSNKYSFMHKWRKVVLTTSRGCFRPSQNAAKTQGREGA